MYIIQLDAAQRSCTVKIVNDSQVVKLCITFPSHYPNAVPGFILDPSTNIDTPQQKELLQVSKCCIRPLNSQYHMSNFHV